MHWWQSPFSSPSSTSSSKHHQHSDDNVLKKLFPRRAFRSQHRGRSTKLRYRSADDTAPDDHRHNTLWRSPSASTSQPHSSSFSSSPSRPSPVVPPQPLPLPVLEELLRRDAAAASPSTSWSPADLPLPSPKQRPNTGQEDGDRERGDDGATPASNNACHECQRHKEHANTRRSVKAPQELNCIERHRDPYLFSIPNSAPSSPFSSPSRSPQRIPRDIFTSPVFKSPKVFQAWSAPEMRPLDTHVGSAFSYQMSPEGKSAFSVESSPLHSPRVSPQRCSRSPGGPTSPTAHRLPLPPGATSPTKISPVSPIVMPIKSQWQKGKLIGRGTFGSVYVASNRETGALCAMKEVELFFDDPKSAECIKQLEQEIKVLSNLQHPNIVQYYGSEVDGDRLYIYLEYVHPGSINKYILDHCGVMSESVVRSFTRHILCGLAYLHSTRTIHRDIKCANLLVDASGVVKLADFGMAKHLAGPAANLSLKGSPYWMAPELLQSVMQKDASSDLALAVDIWSLGCTIIEMLNGKPPWSEYEGVIC
ncbi:mitogen-activated protein kinase kinase kinase 5 isoform X2 [Rhododendron vialii]|uniref:mitogen-activated protein kinase kinase kinase 5 isoform X2 n=1 Tax=Rhododendron vialii TaxID=182163 RepID=UPI00265E103C|nr:mitogen-activated protein kinase kinase kinase 5 isoform X2 [Rhododendron vialii]